ncbi:MAG: ATP-binding protein, partial [Verrucomicrobia bacterium]|nr:ATP-binding protein [Verrucomicrobiota bacterium]
MHKGSHDLARRAIKYEMLGLSLREYIELRFNIHLPSYPLSEIIQNHERLASQIIERCEAIDQKIIPLFQHYLKCGYYPYFFELPNEEFYFITLEQNIHATIEVDLAAIYPHLNGVSINKLKQLLIFIAKSVPFTPNWTTIKDTLEIGDARTVKTYFQYLQDAYLVRCVGKGNKKFDHMNSPEKVYLDNPNQMQALCAGAANSGSERETFFLDMLSLKHSVTLAQKGDFLIDGNMLFEIGGRKKTFEQ